MKTILSLIAVAALLVACGNDSELENATDNVQDAAAEVSEGFGDAVDKVDGDSAAEDAVEEVEAAAGDVMDSAKDMADSAGDAAGDMADSVEEKAKNAADSVEDAAAEAKRKAKEMMGG